MKRATTLRLIVAAAALGILTAMVGGGAATASPAAKAANPVVITAEKEGKELFFEGPKTVEQGQVLKFKNNTDPRKIGPHTLTLVTKASLPKTPEEIKACEKKFEAICGAIIEWHEVNLDTGEVGVNPVEAGKAGWDTQGTLKRKGDSVALEREGQSFKQKVSAPEGSKLNFICAVHAGMQGKIKVEG